MFKVVAVYGSARKKGNSAALVERAVSFFEGRNAEIEKFYLTDMDFKPCCGCMSCNKQEKCVYEDDMSKLLQAISESDFIIFGFPIYMFEASGVFHEMINRLYPMVGGTPGRYQKRYGEHKCMLIMASGGPSALFAKVPRNIKRVFKALGLEVIGTVGVSARQLQDSAKEKEAACQKVDKICTKFISSMEETTI